MSAQEKKPRSSMFLRSSIDDAEEAAVYAFRDYDEDSQAFGLAETGERLCLAAREIRERLREERR